jgi:hypothetical protein
MLKLLRESIDYVEEHLHSPIENRGHSKVSNEFEIPFSANFVGRQDPEYFESV